MQRRTYLLGGASLGTTFLGGLSGRLRQPSRLLQDDSPVAVRIVDTNAPVAGGDLLEVAVEVTNAGDTDVRPTIEYVVDGERRVTVETTIEAGETKSLRRFQDRTYPSEGTAERTVRVEAAGDADERTVEVRPVDGLDAERMAPSRALDVRPDSSVLFEVDSTLADGSRGETHWFVDGDYEGRSMGPWYGAYRGQEGTDHWRHTFESAGTHEVTAAVVGDDENRRATWTVRAMPDGDVRPAVDASRPARGSLELASDETAELELDVTDPGGDLDRVVWWLGHADVLLGTTDVSGAADTAALTLEGGCHGCPILAWVIDEDNRITAESVWEIDGRTSDDPDQPLDRHLVVFSYSSEHTGTYGFEVDGEVERAGGAGNAPFDHRAVTVDADEVDGGRVTGGVAGGGDAYRFSGDLESFSVDRGGDHVFAYVDGAPLDDWTAANRPSHLAITGGSADGHAVSYALEATGSVAQSERARDAPFADDVVTDDPEDEIRGSRATGGTAGGVDAFYYSGDLTQFRIDDCDHESVRVWIDGVEVDPCAIA